MPADPAETERGGGLVLLARDRLHRAARRLSDLRATPEDESDRRRGERIELQPHADGRQREVDDEDRHEDRQAAPDLDVQADQRTRRPEVDRERGTEQDPDQGAAGERGPRDPQRALDPLLGHVADGRLDPVGQAHRASFGSASRASSSRISAESVQTMVRYETARTVNVSMVWSVSALMFSAVVV